MNDQILNTTQDGRSQMYLCAQEQLVWLTPLEIVDLFDATKKNISPHLKNGRTSSRTGGWIRIELSRNS